MDYTLNQRELDFLRESNAIEDIWSVKYSFNNGKLEGHDGAWKLFRDKARNRQIITLDDICRAQRMIMEEQRNNAEDRRGISQSEYGVFRSVENPRNVSVGSYVKPHYIDVPRLMSRFYEGLKRIMPASRDIIKDAAIFHKQFEDVHPFTDGNGRTGRLIANYMLAFRDHPIIVFPSKNKRVYYESLASEANCLMVDYFKEQASKSID